MVEDKTAVEKSRLDAIDVEALRQRAQKLREQRAARQAARIQLLKNMHLQKVPTQSLFLGSAKKEDKPKIVDKLNTSNLNKIPKPKVNDVKNTTINNVNDLSKTKPIESNKWRKSVVPSVNVPKLNNTSNIIHKNDGTDGKNLKLNNTFSDILAKSRRIETASKARMSMYPRIESKTQNVTKKVDIDNKKVNVVENNKVINKRQTMLPPNLTENKAADKKVNMAATVERLSKPKTFSKPNIVANKTQLPITKLPNKNVIEKRTTIATTTNTTKFVPRKSVVPSRKSVAPIPPKKTLNNDKPSKVQFQEKANLRRSLSTVHFKRMGEDAAEQCFKRTLSMGNIKHKEIEEEVPEFPPKNYILPVCSEKKKSVTFFTPMRKSSTPNMCLNTPKPSELRKRLNDWLQKRGKSLSTFHHLKCFGLKPHESLPTIPDLKFNYDDEDKENVEVKDDDSFNENLTGEVVDNATGWRHARTISECSDATQPSPNKIANGTPLKEFTPVDRSKKTLEPLVSDALNDLNQLILEDYSWLHCAEWLRAIVRECGENVKDIPAYWECRAALEEKRGDFVRTVDCFNNALQRGAQTKNIEESLDKLLNKFMKLNLDPHYDANNTKISNQKLLDVKNVFKSSLIKFAISMKNDDGDNMVKKRYTATPVRRSSRISHVVEKQQPNKISPKVNHGKTNGCVNGNQKIKTPEVQLKSATKNQTASARKHLVQLCDSLRNVDDDIKQTLIFVPNKALNFNDCM